MTVVIGIDPDGLIFLSIEDKGIRDEAERSMRVVKGELFPEEDSGLDGVIDVEGVGERCFFDDFLIVIHFYFYFKLHPI